MAVAVLLWLPPLRSSFWLDETGTLWTIKDGLGPAFDRALDFQGQSPLYYVIAWLSRAVFGTGELALRLPSVAALVAATYVVGRIGKRLFDDRAGWLAAIAFACTSSVAFAAADARPYALALFTSTAATLALIRWLDAGRTLDLILTVAAAALTIYAHYLSAVVFGAHVLYAASRRSRNAPSVRQQLTLPLWVALACLPLIPQFAALWDRRGSLSSAIVLRPTRLAVIAVVPVAMAAGAILLRIQRGRSNDVTGAVVAAGLVVFLVFAITDVSGLESLPTPAALALVGAAMAIAVAVVVRLRQRGASILANVREHRDVLVLLLTWSLLPPLVMYALSAADVARVFVPRYYVSAAPGVALLAAWMIRSVRPPKLQILLAAGMLAGAVISFEPSHFTEDWRGALNAASAAVTRGDEPVLIRTDFIEARSTEWLRDPIRSDWLLAPVAAYGVRGKPYLLPYGITEPEARYVLDLEAQVLRDADAFIVVTNRIHTYQGLLRDRFAGFRTRSLGRFGSIRVTEVTRR